MLLRGSHFLGENVDKLFERVSCVVYERLANINTVKLEEKSQVSMGNNLGECSLLYSCRTVSLLSMNCVILVSVHRVFP